MRFKTRNCWSKVIYSVHMNTGTARMVGLLAALLLPAAGFAAQAGGVAASASGPLHKQLQHTQAELLHQRSQTNPPRASVADLEKISAANRAALEQRDREIAELRR